jgi:hypothetical protein
MTFRFHKTTIYYKQFYAFTSLNKASFSKLCKKIENFPLKEDYPEIKGLYLSGEHFFKKVLLSEAKELGLTEIEQIKHITPIVDLPPVPFIMEQNYFEVSLPTEGKSYKKLLDSISIIEEYYNDLLEDVTGQKIEIHLRGGAGASLSRHIYQKAIPEFPKGVYKYQATENKNIESGEILLPAEFVQFPENIKKLIKIIKGPFTLKLVDNQNKVILKQIKRQEIGLSFYSDQSIWFCDTLNVCKNARLFEEPILSPNRYRSLPHLTGGNKRN